METETKDTIKFKPSNGSKEVIQSYKLTTARNDIGLYGQRLILRLVEAANSTGITEGLDFRHGTDLRKVGTSEVKTNLFSNYVRISMPGTALMGGVEEYTKMHDSVKACMGHIIEYVNDKGKNVMFPLLSYAEFSREGVIVEVRKEMWEALLDFTKGFRRFDLDVALSFRSPYTLRLYQLVSGQTHSLTYSITELKEMLGMIKRDKKGQIVAEKYRNRPSDFISKVIEKAKNELDSCSPYTFTYKVIESRKGAVGRAAYECIRFMPVKQPQFQSQVSKENELVGRSPGAFNDFELTKEELEILKNKFKLTENGIKHNHRLWRKVRDAEAKGIINLLKTLDILSVRASNNRPDDLPRFVIGSLKAILKGYGID